MFLRVAVVVGVTIGLVAYWAPAAEGWLNQTWGRHDSAAYISLTVVCFGMLVFRRTFRLEPCRNWRATTSALGLYFFGGAMLSVLTVWFGKEFVLARDLVGLLMANVAFGWGASASEPAIGQEWRAGSLRSRDRKGAVARECEYWLPTQATAPFRSRLRVEPSLQSLAPARPRVVP